MEEAPKACQVVMLLNQCLAISVSASTANNQKYEPEARKTEINQSNAFNVFLQLVDQNSPQAQAADVQPAGPVVNFKLNEVFKRVEFAGFVVPSWLLLSGTYNDLHCIKSHWASGQLRAPSGLRLETIGKFPLFAPLSSCSAALPFRSIRLTHNSSEFASLEMWPSECCLRVCGPSARVWEFKSAARRCQFSFKRRQL